MGKRIIVQRRGRGTSTYRVRKKAFRHKLKYPSKLEGEGKVLKLFNSSAHTAPLAKIQYEKRVFSIPAFKGMIEGQKINFMKKEIKDGNILKLIDLPIKTSVYQIESKPGDGGVFIKSGGGSKKEKKFNGNCRAIVGVIAGTGRLDKPVIKAGKKYHIKKSKSKLWPRTSAVKMNAIDHPFGSGRAKNPKSKIAKRNAPPGRKVGLIRPKRTGKRK